MLARGWLWHGKSKVNREPMLFIYTLISGLLLLAVMARIAAAL